MKKALSILLCILMFVSVCPVAVLAADGGDGSTEDLPSSAIAISNVDELVMICNEYPADGYYYLTGDIDLSYALGEYGDYYNDGKGWEPIGNENTPFKGTFDGRGYTIKGLSINRPTQRFIGLFGCTSEATIKSCKLDIVKIVGNDYVGGFAGHGYNSTFQNCKLEIGNISGYNCVGGVAGGSNGSTFENCETISGTIETVSSDAKSSHYCGGIVGLGIDYGGYGSIKNCTNNAIIHPRAYSSTSTYYDCTGGITGYWRGGKIIGCVNNAEIAKDSYLPNSTYYGGITGWADNVVITDCTNNGAVTIPKTKYVYNAYAGGIVGYFENCVEITGCTNNAEIKIDFYRDNSYNCYAGGIIGKIQSGTNPAITKCTNTAATTVIISSIATSYAIGSTDSHAFAGGIIGYNESGITTVIDQCLNTGNISGSIERYIVEYSAYYYGCASSGIGYGLSVIKNTVNLGTSEYLSFGNATTIENCYNFSNENTAVYVKQGTAKNCYSISSFTAENGTIWLSNGNSVTRTNKQMRLKSTFEGFDFENTWTMEGNPDFPYPELISNPSSFKKSLASISVAALPDKVNYLEGKDEFDITGAILRLTYDNGTTEKIPMTAEMVSGFDNRKVGKQTVTITIYTYVDSFEVTVEHDYRETVVPPTCIKKGYTQYTCTVCGDNYRGNETDFAKHTYNENVIPSTCTKEGYTEFTCSVCGYSYKDNYTDKAPHDTVSHPGKAAKCTEKGYKDYVTCKNCDYTTFEETPVLGHDTETLGAVAATCKKTGLTEGKRCKRCGEILVKQNVIAKAPHKWDDGKVTKQPLVGVAGERTYTCTVCKTTRTETIAPLAPHYIEVKTTDIGKMLADGIVGALPGITSGALLKTSNASYITDKNGKRLANNIPLATGMRIVLESGSTKLQKDICILGDVDCDGAVTVNDARAALRAAVKLDILKGASLDAARVLGNSTVTVDDARAILRVVVKLDPAKDWLKKVK